MAFSSTSILYKFAKLMLTLSDDITISPKPKPSLSHSYHLINNNNPSTTSLRFKTYHLISCDQTSTVRKRLSYNMSSATKAQSQKIFEKLKTKPANKVCPLTLRTTCTAKGVCRYALIVELRIQRGPRCHSVYISAWIARLTIVTWVSIFRL